MRWTSSATQPTQIGTRSYQCPRKSTPPEKKTCRNTGVRSTSQGLDSSFCWRIYKLKARPKVVFCSQTPVSYGPGLGQGCCYWCLWKTIPEKNTCENIGFQSTKSGAGLQFPPLDRVAKARAKGVSFFTDTGIATRYHIYHYHRYHRYKYCRYYHYYYHYY